MAAVLLAGCAAPASVLDEPPGAFRVRSDASAALNADVGWAGATDEPVTVDADRPFRLRFEASPAAGDSVRLQVRRNGGAWADLEAHDFPYPETATPRVSVVSTVAYEHGEATADLLDGLDTPFQPGTGVVLRAASPAWPGSPGTHGEWEWPLVIRRYADGPVTNEPGDTFGFRLVNGLGRPVEGASQPVVTLAVPVGHLGGTFVETPSRIGPWQARNGDLYVVMEPTETDNVMMIVKSSDGGATWREVDGANRPVADDLEGVGTVLFGGTVHILHQTSNHVWHHAFRTSDHPTAPDTWAVRDELVAEPGKPPTQVASLVARSDGSLVAAYGGPQTVLLRVRSPDGTWGDETVLDPDATAVASGPQLALGTGDVVHLATTDSDGRVWYRTVRPDGTVTSRVQIASDIGTTEYDVGSILPLVVLPDAVVVLYRRGDGRLWERRVRGDGSVTDSTPVSDRAVVQNPVDSDQTGADAVAHGESVHVLLIEDGTGHVYRTSSDAAGAWAPAVLEVGDVNAQWIRGQRLLREDGRTVYGYVYDAGSDGGAGMNRYGEVTLGD